MTNDIFARFLPLIDAEMRKALGNDVPIYAGHYGMLRYHMGWVDELFQPAVVNSGKRIRPVLCLLACQAAGAPVERALPAAAALELLHNFSLIHDDIEDDSPTRRHRPTVWALWGRPQAINAGDAMFTLARHALYGLAEHHVSAEQVLNAFRNFDETCVRLTEGQYLDMSFEGRMDVTVDEYLSMIAGKTAALIGASLYIGALIGGAGLEMRSALAEFGRQLGLAFQIQDDILGIWGDEAVTGKSAASDILTRKKSLPVVYALADGRVGDALQAIYAQPIDTDGVPAVLRLLADAGARPYAASAAQSAHQHALEALDASGVLADDNEAGQALWGIAEMLLGRQS
ncbi:MAG: polyprenyl synthetase family protein [Anaerolineales bacterium]|nr:polyprenyl synthetase family protein [Anaerolineae bacterium]MCB9143053.1 polyprenyl synthetase family protein [Anaerolineales bacterium]MCO5246235.1 polyprenyl synthetase family protein [Anaerolineae bacterium]